MLFIASFTTGHVRAQESSVNEALNLIQRVIPTHAKKFSAAYIPSKGKDVFEIESGNGKIILRGNNGVAIGSALNYYLKNFANCHISWNGSNLSLPANLPVVPKKIRIESPHTYRYYLNYCTFNYTMSWWNWERWEKEIDWMALNGINMPLSITGQNSIWNKVYKSLGFTEGNLKSFFSGPAYFNWFWMGNLDGWGGPLSESFMQRQEELQKKILERQRALGMKPILPAFTGHVPPSFIERFPSAKLKKTEWQGFAPVYILDPEDSMFTVIGKKFTEELIRTFGTDHFYSADTFNENTPPTNDSLYLDGISKKVYQSMADVDSNATWVMQGWMFSYSSKYWQPTQIKALLNAVPDDKMIILDLYSESKPMWEKTDAYYGKPWIWCMLHNFGGNISMYGRMKNVANDPVTAMKSESKGKLSGIGLTPEAIEQNPVMYELMLEHAWKNEEIDLNKWLKDYARRRYGKSNKDIDAAWQILRSTVYDGGITSGGNESIIVSRPTLLPYTRWANTRKSYNPAHLVPALQLFLKSAEDLKNSEGFKYDLIDISRQVLANYADTLQRKFSIAYNDKDTIAFKKYSREFLELIDDLDLLLKSHKDFLLGNWLNSAKEWEILPEEKGIYEKNARNLITTWGDKDSRLSEYSNRQWSGLLSDYYKPRWERFISALEKSIEEKSMFREKDFHSKIMDWEWEWINSRNTFSSNPSGDPVEAAKEAWKKYGKNILTTYSIQ